MTFNIDHTKKLTLNDLKNFLADKDSKVALTEATKKSILDCRNFLDEKLKNNNGPIYGINTGFGSLCNVIIPDNDLEQLQENLVKSHACGMGLEVPQEIVKLMGYLDNAVQEFKSNGARYLSKRASSRKLAFLYAVTLIFLLF